MTPVPRDPARDRLRELLDAVLDESHENRDAMARGAHSSPFHFSRRLTAATGEAPVALRRRLMLERAAWQLRQGAGVTETALAAGFASSDGFARAFARAFGCPPSRLPAAGSHRLPAPNGIHFHPPTALWVSTEETPMDPLTRHLVAHDLDDTAALLQRARDLTEADYRAVVAPGTTVLDWDGAEESVAAVLTHHVRAKEVWVAAIVGEQLPEGGADDAGSLVERQAAVAPRWHDVVRDLDRRQAWDDLLVDALCEPPQTFVLGGVVAHVLTYGAHRRQLARHLLRSLGHHVDTGDPIVWLHERAGASS